MTQDKENNDMYEVEQRALESVADQQDINETLDMVETKVSRKTETTLNSCGMC